DGVMFVLIERCADGVGDQLFDRLDVLPEETFRVAFRNAHPMASRRGVAVSNRPFLARRIMRRHPQAFIALDQIKTGRSRLHADPPFPSKRDTASLRQKGRPRLSPWSRVKVY